MQTVQRWLLAGMFIAAGISHFTHPKIFLSILPKSWPAREEAVYVSGFFEILGGLGALIPKLRRPAGWGLIALLIAVYPANIYHVVAQVPVNGRKLPRWALALRLPLQFVMMAWVHRTLIREE